ncbi:tape measure protein [Acinetobacter lwoffii]|uniref:tape measure protein n=1 Tax=Acinetobacter lwoffii TaxID=28090 RepID=UPI003F93C9EB
MAGSLDFRLNLLANTTGLQQGMDGARFALNALAGAMAALGVGLGIRELAQAADSYTNLSARINIATKDGGDFTSAMAGVHQVALATNSSLDATGSLFTRLNTVGKEMGMTQQNTLDLTKTINQAIQTSGGTAEAGEAAITQLIQAMQGGVLRGEEFNSIMENGYGVAEALAKGLGVTTGELRKMAENGELGAERVYKALLSQKDAVQQTYDSFPLTVSNALQKIATSWQILIGEVDQANGASATAAQWLSTLADNMSLLKPIIDDIGDGFTRFSEYYSNIYDQGTIDSLKTTLISVYDTIKTLFNTVLEVGEAFHDVFSDALSSALGFTDGLYPAGEQVSGFQKFIDLLNIALGFLSDGFKTIGIGVNLFTGTLYGLLAVWYELKSKLSWGDAKKEAIANMEAMRAKSEEYFTKGFDGAKNFESKTIETIQNIGKTDKEKNQERIADSQQTLEQLKAQEEKHKTDYKAISDERVKAEQQLFEARKTGNQAAIDLAVKGLAEIDVKEKAYQAESKKITDDKIKAAQDWVNAQLTAADGTQKAADAATQKTLQTTLAAQGLKLEFDATGKAIVKAMDNGAKATENQGNATDKARKAATALGLDLDVSLNRVSEKFKAGETNVNSFVAGLEGLGVTGKQAGEVTYEAWQKWTEEAKSQAEIDLAKKGLVEFGNQGVLSAKQVEMGMRYLDEVNGKLPQNISEVEKAYKLLGITSRKEAGEAADAQMRAFNVLKQSGTASVEELRQALINMADKIYASGDAAKIAAYEAKLAYHGLSKEVSETGQVSVKANNAVEESLHRVRNATGNAGDGFDDLGRRGVRAGNDTTEAWEEARKATEAAMASQGKMKASKTGTTAKHGLSVEEIEQRLKDIGYEGDTKQKAKELFQDAEPVAGGYYKSASNEWVKRKYGTTAYDNQKALGNAMYVMEQIERLEQYVGKNGRSTGFSSLNDYAPSTPSSPSTSNLQGGGKTVNYQIQFDGKTLDFSGTAEQESLMNQLVNQLKVQAKST